MNDLYPHLQNGDGLTNLGFSNRCNAFVWQDDATGETVIANGRSEAREKLNARRMVTVKHATQPRQYIDSARDVTPVKTMADKIAKSCDDWTCNFCGIAQPAWAGDCLTCETVPMMGDRD